MIGKLPLRFRVPSEYRLLGLMLIPLHLAIWSDFGGAISRALMLAHLGLFLIWQPLWRRDERLTPAAALTFVALTIGFVAWLNWWTTAFWVLLLTGLVGGRRSTTRADRYAHMIALLFLVIQQ